MPQISGSNVGTWKQFCSRRDWFARNDRSAFGSIRVCLDSSELRRSSSRSEVLPELRERVEFVVVDLLFGRTVSAKQKREELS